MMMKVSIILCVCLVYLVDSAPVTSNVEVTTTPFDNDLYIIFKSKTYGNKKYIRNPNYIYQQDIYSDEDIARMPNNSNYLHYRDLYETADAELAGHIVNYISDALKLVGDTKVEINTVAIIVIFIFLIILFIAVIYLCRKYRHITQVIEI